MFVPARRDGLGGDFFQENPLKCLQSKIILLPLHCKEKETKTTLKPKTMEKVEFIQFEIFNSFNGGKRVCQFGGSAADRAKLIRKARRIAKKIVAEFGAYKAKYNMTNRDRVSIRAWRGIAFLETRPDGGLVLRGSANYNGSESLPVDYPIKDREEFFRCYCSACVRSTANYDREFTF